MTTPATRNRYMTFSLRSDEERDQFEQDFRASGAQNRSQYIRAALRLQREMPDIAGRVQALEDRVQALERLASGTTY